VQSEHVHRLRAVTPIKTKVASEARAPIGTLTSDQPQQCATSVNVQISFCRVARPILRRGRGDGNASVELPRRSVSKVSGGARRIHTCCDELTNERIDQARKRRRRAQVNLRVAAVVASDPCARPLFRLANRLLTSDLDHEQKWDTCRADRDDHEMSATDREDGGGSGE